MSAPLLEAVIAREVADSIGRALFSVVRAEEMDRRRGDAWEELNDLRCLDCETRYAERQQYRCEYPGTHTAAYPIYGAGHCYEKAEVDRLIIATGGTS